ncbi:arginine repressor [Egibacter rhizosphaerae]|uniref:Arginine repressor n=1 Tax=Egibacter rhizosphaerae TaxID=1670831 RepID=A0A411YK62_9ACTN|nr:arginine repressor [Egibacter rhizosphaerae]QBI21571.1 arginine repressor [Egibacter rhizosphaerae]
MTERAERQRFVRDLVARYEVASQRELVELLAAEGLEATQATVSRDLDELGIGKQRGADGRVAYALPEPGGVAQRLRQFATAIDASGNLAVIRTPPGAAAAVASAIDDADLPHVLATVQGDDTLLVVAEEGRSGAEIAELLRVRKEARPPVTVPREQDEATEPGRGAGETPGTSGADPSDRTIPETRAKEAQR